MSTKRVICKLIHSWLIVMFSGFTLLAYSSTTSNYTAAPPFLVGEAGKPNVMIALDISGSMKAVAYRDVDAGNWRNGLHDDFSPDKKYFGYFDTSKKYSYKSGVGKNFFHEDAAGTWDGNFLNWLAMRRMDIARKTLVGGKVRDRNGETIDGETWYIIEGQNEPLDYTFQKQYSLSSEVSPFPNDTTLLISEGEISAINEEAALKVSLSKDMEIGQVSLEQDAAESIWVSVTFVNSYATTPAVVVTGVSYNGGQPVQARIRNVTTTGFDVRLEEWAYLDGGHTTEEVTYIVAAQGSHTLTVDGTSVDVRAGSRTTNTTDLVSPYEDTILFGGAFSATPVVFSGIATYNDTVPAVTRNSAVTTSSFRVRMQEEEANNGVRASERIDWIAIDQVVGTVDDAGVAIDITTTGNTVTHDWHTHTFDPAAGFSAPPLIAVNMQTFNGNNTANVRYGDGSFTKDSVRIQIDEETSLDSEVSHIDEDVGVMAVGIAGRYRIALGVSEEPKGIIQNNSGSLRFGVAVYNYDHSLEPTEIYNGNKVHGGTMHPCYPDVNLAVSDRTNFDICLETHVKAPLDNIIDVIEDHPLIWGTTPIAETLYDIKGYFAQENRNRNGHNQWYDNGTEGLAGERDSYEINNDWDPYYYDEIGGKAPCAKSFVLHFNDGAPFADFDGDASQHPVLTGDGDGNKGQNEALDDIAYEIRNTDCRTDAGMTGHQGLISYYVYAALGEDEANNTSTKRMREAAVNGGFVDDDDDDTPNQPDPAHPSNFVSYMGGTCTANEWDQDADCNPDTFYFANDGDELVAELEKVFRSITLRAASGGASSVIAASRSGEGAVFNAIFQTSAEKGEEAVKWVGDVHAMMIDAAGNLRADDGDKVLEGPETDGYVDYCTEETDETRIVRVKVSLMLDEDDENYEENPRPTAAETAACSESVFPLGLFDLDSEYVWSSSNWLESLSDAEVLAQRTYTSAGAGRHIITAIDGDGGTADDIITSAEIQAFLPSEFPDTLAGLLGASDASEAANIVNWIRGADQSGMRSRQLDGVTKRLGDIIYSTPTVVGRPAENLDLLYGDSTYRTFFLKYRFRRQVIYAGSNSGMLHAFNGGWYNADTKTFAKAKGGSAAGSNTLYELGAELWAYVPYNLLPHLRYLTNESYGQVISDHAHYVDLKPRIFDAKIFTPSDKHPGGWGTILVGGMRFGGGRITVDADTTAATDSRTLRSAFFILDVTDPDSAPEVLLEYTHPNLGFTSAVPTPIYHDGNWYLMLGSGPDITPEGFDDAKSTQAARLFLLNLNNIASGSGSVLETSFGTNGILTLSEANSFVSDLVAVDYGLDAMKTDSIYFGTVSGDPSSGWSGKLNRIVIQEVDQGAQKAITDWAVSTVYDAGLPITASPTVGVDSARNRWVYVGTGRFLTQGDRSDSSVNKYFGIKEPRNTDGSFSWTTVTGLVDVSAVQVKSGAAGELLNPPTLSEPLPEPTSLEHLELRMLGYSVADEYLPGWSRNLAAGERNFGAATLLGGSLTFTTYDPDNLQCSIDGDSLLYVLNSATGTAADVAIIGEDGGYFQFTTDLGSMPATTPSLHTGEDYEDSGETKAIIQKSDGSIFVQEQDNQKGVRSGEMSWRRLQ